MFVLPPNLAFRTTLALAFSPPLIPLPYPCRACSYFSLFIADVRPALLCAPPLSPAMSPHARYTDLKSPPHLPFAVPPSRLRLKPAHARSFEFPFQVCGCVRSRPSSLRPRSRPRALRQLNILHELQSEYLLSISADFGWARIPLIDVLGVRSSRP
ncbi:hypothetical protein BC628DRAFT_945252 [Trametes gibbosa]|nr:hypothetical protein BC628DRAFT_945252 [Trametes gibbosa]